MNLQFSVSQAFLDTIEDKEHLLEIYEDIDNEVYSFKWKLARLWMFGHMDLTDEEQLAVAGLI